MTSARRRPWLAATAVAVLALGNGYVVQRATGDTTPDTATDAVAAPRLRVTAEQWRTDEVARNLAVALRNDGDVPVRVSRVELRLPSFTGAGAVPTEALLPVGGLRVDVPVPYGTGTACAAASSAPSHVVVDAAPEGGPTSRMTLPLPYPNVLLDRLVRQDCQIARAARSVSVGFAPWRPTRAGWLRGGLVVTRAAGAGSAPVTVADLGGNVLYNVKPVQLGALPAGVRTVTFPLVADVVDCDPHAVAEVKKPYEFPVRLVLGSENVPTTVTVSAADRLTLDTLLRRRCGLPPRGQ